MVKAVIFDCFGVLASEAWLPFKAKYFGHDTALYQQVTDISHQGDRGIISHEEALEATAKLAGITVEAAEREIRQNVPDEELFDYLRELKPNYRLGFLSNVADGYMRQIFNPEQLAVFDAIVLSYKIGVTKPEPEAYIITAQKLGVKPDECVLVDDQEHNVAGARRASMQAILYHDLDQFKTELVPLLANAEG